MLRCSHQQWVLYGLAVAAAVAPTAAGTEARRACVGMGGDPNDPDWGDWETASGSACLIPISAIGSLTIGSCPNANSGVELQTRTCDLTGCNAEATCNGASSRNVSCTPSCTHTVGIQTFPDPITSAAEFRVQVDFSTSLAQGFVKIYLRSGSSENGTVVDWYRGLEGVHGPAGAVTVTLSRIEESVPPGTDFKLIIYLGVDSSVTFRDSLAWDRQLDVRVISAPTTAPTAPTTAPTASPTTSSPTIMRMVPEGEPKAEAAGAAGGSEAATIAVIVLCAAIVLVCCLVLFAARERRRRQRHAPSGVVAKGRGGAPKINNPSAAVVVNNAEYTREGDDEVVWRDTARVVGVRDLGRSPTGATRTDDVGSPLTSPYAVADPNHVRFLQRRVGPPVTPPTYASPPGVSYALAGFGVPPEYDSGPYAGPPPPAPPRTNGRGGGSRDRRTRRRSSSAGAGPDESPPSHRHTRFINDTSYHAGSELNQLPQRGQGVNRLGQRAPALMQSDVGRRPRGPHDYDLAIPSSRSRAILQAVEHGQPIPVEVYSPEFDFVPQGHMYEYDGFSMMGSRSPPPPPLPPPRDSRSTPLPGTPQPLYETIDDALNGAHWPDYEVPTPVRSMTDGGPLSPQQRFDLVKHADV
eukprot:m.57756 g.57756  ORF g.57756 m.57756 type:complete len:636 (-) comp9371_c0_seq1:140-2047(-)